MADKCYQPNLNFLLVNIDLSQGASPKIFTVCVHEYAQAFHLAVCAVTHDL